jgi:hypothetical protein
LPRWEAKRWRCTSTTWSSRPRNETTQSKIWSLFFSAYDSIIYDLIL